MDWIKLIREVKKRPYLWKTPRNKRNTSSNTETDILWEDISKHVGISAKQCIVEWRQLLAQYEKHKQEEDKLLKESPSTIYNCTWKFYEELKFLNDIYEDCSSSHTISTSKSEVEVDKLDLIAKVKERPYLWRVPSQKRNGAITTSLWEEIGDHFGIDADACKTQWRTLRSLYRINRQRESTEGRTCKWVYYEHLKFLDVIIDAEADDTDQRDTPAFIAKVKERPELWRVKGKRKYAKYKIECLWKEISELLDISYERCRYMWRQMRSRYKRHKEMEETFLKSNLKYNHKWKPYELLKFLDSVDVKPPDRFALIAKVKENPEMWNSNVHLRDANKATNKWKEIADFLRINEQTCINIWTDLRLLFFKHKEKRDRLLEETPSANYQCPFEYFDHLKFLDEEAQTSFMQTSVYANIRTYESKKRSNSTTTAQTSGAKQELFQVDKFKLISNIQERPYLWKTENKLRNKQICDYYWSQVKESLGLTGEQCAKQWNELRSVYNKEKKRIELLKQNGVSNEEYESEWEYFEHLKFLDFVKDTEDVQVLSPREERVRLITEVKKRPNLWKQQCKGAKLLNGYIWAEVAEILGLEVNLCRSQWRGIKQNYKKKYMLFKKNKIDINRFCKVTNYELLQFLNEVLEEELKATTLKNQNETVDASPQNFDKDSFDDNVAETEENLSYENSKTHYLTTELESVRVKEESQLQSPSFTNIPLIEALSITAEIEFKEPDKSLNDIAIKKENTNESNSIEGEAESNKRYNLQELTTLKNEELIYKVKEEPNTYAIFIKEEFDNDFPERQANQFVNIDNECIREEQVRAINSVPIKNECLKIESYITNWVKTTDDSDIEFLKDIARDEIDDTCAIKKIDIPSGSKFENEKTNSCYNVTNKDFDVKPYISNWVKNREISDIEFITDLAEANEVGTSNVMQKLSHPSGSKLINKNTPESANVSNESLDVKPYISHWMKNREVSNNEFIPDNEVRTSNVMQKLNLPIGSELVNKNTKNSQVDNSAMDSNEDKAELNKCRKRSHKNTNGSKVLKKQRKKNN